MIGNCFGNDPIDRELERSADAALERWVSGCVGKDCERCKHYGQWSKDKQGKMPDAYIQIHICYKLFLTKHTPMI